MRSGGKGDGGAFAACAVLVALAILTALMPGRAAATDSGLKQAYAFKLEASNGYSILAFAASQQADGRGEVVLLVAGRDGDATYVAPATVTATRIDADLGSLGKVSLEVVPSGRKRKLRSRCGDGPEAVVIEPQLYRGAFEFHGEEGYTDATSTSPHEYTRFFLDLVCGVSRGEISGGALPGARLRLHSRHDSLRLSLRANKNRPRARTRFEVEIDERRRGIAISRSRTLWAGSGAFRYDPLLRTATLAPPAPFSGHASYRRAAAVANRWRGNLTLDLPGRSNVSLTGPGVGATLIHACFQGEGAGSRADCGF